MATFPDHHAPGSPAAGAPVPGSPVLVVGAGPVGLTAARELARRGVPVRLVDAAPGPAPTSRAVAVHPRTLETFDQMGVARGVLASGRHNKAFTMYAAGRRLVRLQADYAAMPTRFPYTVVIEQTRTEELLREACAEFGVRPEWGVRLTGLTQDAHGVRARLVHADGTVEEYRTPWLVGCDGGHSAVRKQLALPLLGESSETWQLADAPVTMDLPPDTIYWAHADGHALMMVPYLREGHWRLLDTAPGPNAADETPAEAAARFSAKLSAGLGREVRVGEPSWTSVFTFQQRMVPTMNDGRVFVAGDAAHVHSPASGQGMNTGIQEAYNLAWKLAMVVHGQAGRALLDTYSQERVPVGRALLGSTGRATFLVQFKNTLAPVMLPLVFAVVRRVPALRRRIQRKVLGGMSGLLRHYAESPLTTPGEPPLPPAGSRAAAVAAALPEGPCARALYAELRDVRWSLLYVPDGGTADRTAAKAAGAGEWLSVRAIGAAPGQRAAAGAVPLPDPGGHLRAALGTAAGGWVLVRPDGYLAAGGTRLTDRRLERALSVLGPVPLHRSSGGSPAVPDTVVSTTRVMEGSR
ncbi:FAD-dependent oxidoreductase [Streptomyces sp. NPDC004111]|uniref:FAD-dependent oxidoreductase n=1 Tax=Streptomyces sp. NPDC004111 TaxID=3364690 RepID=UPI0036ADE0B1